MEISRQQWHTRIYLWWYGHKYRTQRFDTMTNKMVPNPPVRSNLCPYVRAVLFWAPLRFIFWNWTELGTFHTKRRRFHITLNMVTVPLILLAIPLMMGLFSTRWTQAVWIAYGVWCLATIVVLLINRFAEWMKWRARLRTMKQSELDRWMEKMEKKRNLGPGRATKFGRLIAEYFRAGHDRICPELSIIDEQEDKRVDTTQG